MRRAITSVSESYERSGEGRTDHAGAARLDRLRASTTRSRGRAERKTTTAFRRHAEATDNLAGADADAEQARTGEALAWTQAAASQDAAHPEDRGRRGLSNVAYGLMLGVVWAVTLPVAVATFQIFGESLVFTVLLALVADAVFLLVAHGAGVTLRRAHLSHDAGLVLGVELWLGWSLLLVGILGALASGWIRWSYLRATGTGSGLGGILFTTILALATLLLTTLAAWRNHHPAVAAAERATKRRRRADKRAEAARRQVRRTTERCAHRVAHQRLLAQRVVAKADRRLRHSRVVSARTGRAMTVEEPAWLAHERALAAAPIPGSPLQPLNVESFTITPPIIPPLYSGAEARRPEARADASLREGGGLR